MQPTPATHPMNDWQAVSVPQLPFLGSPKWQPHFSSKEDGRPDREEMKDRRKIIVIDDEILIAETVVEILKEEGFHAIAISSADDAIEMARTAPPDLVLSDVVMPGMTGVEIGIRIREIAPQCKVILFSGQAATMDLVEKARRQGHKFEILAKPIRPEALIGVVRRQFSQA